jgi:Family of unknown function (DUF6312)
MDRIELVRTVRREGEPDVIVYRRRPARGRKKRGSKQLRMAERAVDQMARAGQALTGTYSERHRYSNRRKKDGWLRDLNDNLYRAARNANRQVDVLKIFGL